LILDKCFRNKSKKYQIQDLVDTVNEEMKEVLPDGGTICRRTIYNDIEFMRSPEGGLAEIIKFKDGVKVFYRYEDTSFSIANNPFTEEERQYMKALVETLSRFKGLPQLETLRESLANIQLLSLEPDSSPCLEFEENPFISGIEHLQYLHNAILSKAPQELVYQPYQKDPIRYSFHPQYLKQYNHRWYVLGVNTGFPDSVSNFPLDRIVSLKPLGIPYIASDIDWSEYFDDVIGVSIPPTGTEEIHIVVHGRSGYYIESNPLHPSQRSRWTDSETLDVKLTVRINYELRRTLLSYADCITIVAPETLKKEMQSRLEGAFE